MKTSPTIIECLEHPKIWRRWLEPDPATRAAWFTLWQAIFGLPMDERSRRTFRECAQRFSPAPGGYREIYLIVGRRGGKSFFMAVTGVYLAACRKWRATPGERLVVLLVAVTARQARSLMAYVRSLLLEVPALAGLVVRETQTEIELSTGVGIVIEVADHRSIRGATIVAGLVDEAAFLPPDGSTTDAELLVAIRAGMISVADEAILVVGSTPYARRGALWAAYRRWFGKIDARQLVWQAPSRTMNPTLDAREIDLALAEDREAARAEYLAQFRDDVSNFVDRQVVEDAVIGDRLEVAPGTAGIVNLRAAVDAAGGAGQDSYALAVAGRDAATGKAVLMCVREVKPPFSPEQVTAELATVIKSYGLSTAAADKFGGSWPAEQFAKHNVTLTASKTSSEIFVDFLPVLMSRKAELLSLPVVINQISNLERHTGRGRDHIAAGGTGHDDVAVVVASALVQAACEEAQVPFPGELFIATQPRNPILSDVGGVRITDFDIPRWGWH